MMQVTAPAAVPQHKAVTLSVEQEFQGQGHGNAAGVQFSNADNGPWVTARPPGGGGAVEAAAVPFDAQATAWEYEGVIWHANAFARVATFQDQSLEGDPIEVVGAWSDVTARKQLGEALAAARERLEHLLSSAPAVIYSYKATGDFAPTFVSQNITDWLGYEPSEYLENPEFWWRCVHPDDRAKVEAESVRLYKKGRHTIEYRFLKKGGSYCWVIDEQHGVTIHGAAFYRDEYVKVGGAWKIRHTGYERTFEEMAPRKAQGWTLTQRRAD